ncbi:MAG: hypothetical protein MZV64_18320 [Ignavibacteriales bacterium]|nr:hypothetical protein [Ignavibacteriales bacterium]
MPYLKFLDHNMDYPDAENIVVPLFQSRSLVNGLNARYANPRLDALLELTEVEPSWERRAGLFREVEKVLFQDVPAIPLFSERVRIALRPEVRGVKAPGHGFHLPRRQGHLAGGLSKDPVKLKITIYDAPRLLDHPARPACSSGPSSFVIQSREAEISPGRDRGAGPAPGPVRRRRQPAVARAARTATAVQRYVDDHVDEDLAYIVVYDRPGQPAGGQRRASGRTRRPGRDASSPRTRLRGRDRAPERGRCPARGPGPSGSWRVEVPPSPRSPTLRWGSVKIGMSLEPMYARVREIQKVLLLIGLGGFLLGIAGRGRPGPPHHPAPPAPGRRHGPHRPGRLLPVASPSRPAATRSGTWPGASTA